MSTPRPYGGRSLVERRDTRRQALIEAGLDCLQRDGLSGISVRNVCAQAKLTPRYFYENFANLDELLVELTECVSLEVHDATLAALASGEDIATQTRSAAAVVFATTLHDARKASVVLAASGHEGMHQRQQEWFLRYTDLLLDFLESMEGSIDREQVRPIALFLVGGAVELVSAKIAGLIAISDDELVDRTVQMFLAAWASIGLAVPQA